MCARPYRPRKISQKSLGKHPPKKNQIVIFFPNWPSQPLPPQNVNFLKSIFDLLLIRQKIDLIKCKLWGDPRPPSPFGKS